MESKIRAAICAISLAQLSDESSTAIRYLHRLIVRRPLTKNQRISFAYLPVAWDSPAISEEIGMAPILDQQRYAHQLRELIALLDSPKRPRKGRRLGKPELMDRLALIEELGTQASAVFAEALAGGLNGEAATPAGIAAARSLMAAGGMMGGAVRRARRKRIVDVRWRQGELALEEKG